LEYVHLETTSILILYRPFEINKRAEYFANNKMMAHNFQNIFSIVIINSEEKMSHVFD